MFRLTLCLGFLAVASAAQGQTTNDLWDVSRGNIVTAHSGVLDIPPNFTSSINNMFGARRGTVEIGNTIFSDDHSTGFTHFVEWRTPSPIVLNGFRLYAAHDGDADANRRGFRTFNLFADSGAGFQQIYTYTPTNPYNPNGGANRNVLALTAGVTPVTAKNFRAEFVQFGDVTPFTRGPRVLELDAIGVAVPEPGTLALFGAAGIGAVLLRRRRKA